MKQNPIQVQNITNPTKRQQDINIFGGNGETKTVTVTGHQSMKIQNNLKFQTLGEVQ